ncbi:MAG: SDR family NAD(P)-dependent oxidoreductase [Promethearchaeota archaeon]
MNIVITGSSNGIGKALANRFLIEGEDKVVISSRSKDRVDSLIEEFKAKFPSDNVFGTICDVSNAEDVENSRNPEFHTPIDMKIIMACFPLKPII